MITIPLGNTEMQEYRNTEIHKIFGYRLPGLLSQMVFLQHCRITGMHYGPVVIPERL